ncbi:MAG: PD-(D/E)XK nuclease family protein [Alphaproteobacteria bacterium]|nr:PD-(D/E)XK nuclease family protein [Alphaproteobacteria bacterium]MBN2675611.1 PD-(D/E)XK nuclease family protein [Alphaproteobacteria bacterium]
MVSNKNIFCASNPAKLLEALWEIIRGDIAYLSDLIIFLPSRRAVRSVEKMIVEKTGTAVLLPTLVALGEGVDDESEEIVKEVISNQERIIILAKLLTADPNIRTISAALPIARDLVRMQDYLENEGIDSTGLDWINLVDEKYAAHFQQKAKFLEIVTRVLPTKTANQITQTIKRNSDIRNWKKLLKDKRKIVVCGSTASVPATADLMEFIVNQENGYIILPGNIAGRTEDFLLNTNPYNAEYKFLERINVVPSDVQIIDTGASEIDFFNLAFGNTGGQVKISCNAQLIECARESEEAECVAEIAARATNENKTVLVITPDAAGNQRISEAFIRRGLVADFSGGKSGAMTSVGRAILNLFDEWIKNKDKTFDTEYKTNDFDLFKTVVWIIDNLSDQMQPTFQIDSDESVAVWGSLEKASDILNKNGIILKLSDARAVIADVLSGVSVRTQMNDAANIFVLGTIESRMQTADVIILTGLNEGMFPSIGYENSWLPRHMAEKIGLPSPDRKVSLMSLDFMNLSCGETVYWLRSKTAGSSQTTESRFISRVDVTSNGIKKDKAILSVVRNRDNVPLIPLDYSSPRPPADRSDVYVTELELLIHNPYAFYAKHILRLYPRDDYWKEPDARDFGNLVHNVIEQAVGKTSNEIISELDLQAKKILPSGSVLFHFWHKRFVDIAPHIEKMLNNSHGAAVEIKGSTKIAGRIVRAKADRIWDGCVLDIKTGSAPSKKQLIDGMMPQLPLEAFIMQNNGFPINSSIKSKTPVLQFMQLKNNKVELIEYSYEVAQKMIDASVQKVSELFGRYSKDFESYEYYETSDVKYKAYDDLARVDD